MSLEMVVFQSLIGLRYVYTMLAIIYKLCFISNIILELFLLIEIQKGYTVIKTQDYLQEPV